MNEHEFIIEGKSQVRLKHVAGGKTSSVLYVNFNLDVSDNTDRSYFLDKDDLPTEAGVKALTQCFVQGLLGNIMSAHQKGYWNESEHLRYIISELERGFAHPTATLKDSNFDNINDAK